jgi:hypothetical protein
MGICNHDDVRRRQGDLSFISNLTWSSFTVRCVTSIDIPTSILDSYRNHMGVDLIERSGDPHIDARRLFELDAVVLSHIGTKDPHFIYANETAARVWRTTVDEITGLPSRLSAPPDERESRSSMLREAASAGLITGYSGTRIARDGTLFTIENATLWNVDFAQGPGQAVVFRDWHPIAALETN